MHRYSLLLPTISAPLILRSYHTPFLAMPIALSSPAHRLCPHFALRWSPTGTSKEEESSRCGLGRQGGGRRGRRGVICTTCILGEGGVADADGVKQLHGLRLFCRIPESPARRER